MAKALRTAALVVGAAALVATGIGAAVGAGIIGGVAAGASTATFLGVAGATFTAIGTIAGVAAGLASLASVAIAGRPPPGSVGGNATKFTIEKMSGIPYAMGRTLVGGRVVHRQYYGPKNVYESWVSALSLGPVKALGPLLIDKITPIMFGTAGAAIGAFAGFMWLDQQIGATPEVRALQGPVGAIPGWNATSRLSGIAADLWTLKWDKDGKKFPTGVPVRGRVLEGVLVYDPRLDSTYPGGSGACRLGNEATYVYSENPACHAITWAFGRYQNNILVAGGGLAAAGIDLPAFVEWANVCDANGWKVGGVIFTEADNTWDVLRMIAQAGGGECIPIGARLSCTFSAPRVSIGSITSDDICGAIDVPATASSRVRRNTIIPRVRLEAQGWEMTPLDPVSVPEYVALDGASRPREMDFPLVQNADQGAELALYQMLNDRELDGISIPAKIYALGYRPGDCLTLEIPEANLIGRDVIVREREIDAATMAVTIFCRSETPGKHAFALGTSGTPPRTPDLSNPGIDRSAPEATDWTIATGLRDGDTVPSPYLLVTGGIDDRVADGVVFDYRPYISGAAADANWTGASIEPATVTRREISGVEFNRRYEVGVRYRTRGATSERLILGPVLTPGSNVPLSFTVGARGNAAQLPGHYLHGLRKQDGSPIAVSYDRSYTVCHYNVQTGDWSSRSFDTFGGGEIDYGYGGGIGNGDANSGSDAGAMARYLDAIPAGNPVVVYSSDEPQRNRTSALLNAMYRCGASAATFGGDPNVFTHRCAYILVGFAGAGEGNAAFERAHPRGIDNSPDAWLMTSFSIVNGVLQLGARDGSDGRDGTDGLPGAPGANGQTERTHYAYANSLTAPWPDFTTDQPGTRAYEGRYVDFVEADSQDPTRYAWREYKGPPFGMAARGEAVVAGDQVIKIGAGLGWDSDAYSTVGFRGSAKVSFRFDPAYHVMAGLNTDPTAGVSFASLDAAWYNEPDTPAIRIYESGSDRGTQGQPDPGAVFSVEYDGACYTYSINGMPVRQIEAQPNLIHYFDSSFYSPNARLRDVEFTAGSQRPSGLTLIPHPGAPGTITSANSVRHYGDFGGWGNGKSYSKESYSGGAVAEWTVPAGSRGANTFAGLAQDPRTDSGFTNITFSIHQTDIGHCGVYVAGSHYLSAPAVNPDVDNRYKVHFDGRRYVRFYQNGTQVAVYDWYEAPEGLYFACALASANPRITDISFSQAGARGNDGGTGAPGAPGANGLTPQIHTAFANSDDGRIDFFIGPPGGRAFVGTYTDFNPADSANPDSYDWVQYKGPPGFGLRAMGNAYLSSNAVILSADQGAWGGASAHSTEGWQSGAQTSFKLPTGGNFGGLNTDPTADSHYTSIDYSFHRSGTSTVAIYESGAYIGEYAADVNATFQIVYDNRTITYLINGAVVRGPLTVTPNLTLFFDSALTGVTGNRVTEITFSATGTAGNDGSPGAPGAPGATGPGGPQGPGGAPGAPGSNGQDGYTAQLTAPTFTLPAFANGGLKPGALASATGRFQVTRRDDQPVPAITFSVAGQDGGTMSIDGNGNYALTSMDDSSAVPRATIILRAQVAGVQPWDRAVVISKAPEGSAGYGRAASGNLSLSSTTYVEGFSILSAPTSPGMAVSVNCNANYRPTSNAAALVGKLQYQLNGGAWTDISGAEDTGSTGFPAPNDPGQISLFGLVPAGSIPANATIGLRVVFRRQNGSGQVDGSGRIQMNWRTP